MLLPKLVQFRFRTQKLCNFCVVASGVVVAQSLNVQLLELHCGALSSFVAVISDKAVNSHVCVAGIEEIMTERLAGGDAFGG